MLCPDCGQKMILLFTSAVCDNCEPSGRVGGGGGLDHGFIVWRSRPPGSCEYVFKTMNDAVKWRDAAGLGRFPVRSVATRTPFRWRRSSGSVADIDLADRLYEIYPDANHPAGKNKAYLDT